MSLAENSPQWGNQFTTPWTPTAKARLTELWADQEITIKQMAAILFMEFGHSWSEQSIGWKAQSLKLPRRHVQTIWTKDLETQLTERWRSGELVRVISDLLFKASGIRFTKSAVIGKAHRLGLEKHRKANRVFANALERARHKTTLKREWARTNRGRKNELNRASYARTKERQAAPLIEDYAIPTPQRKTIFELSPHDCRWPVGEPKSDLFFFCGAVAEDDKPYCPSHCRRAYVEIRPR